MRHIPSTTAPNRHFSSDHLKADLKGRFVRGGTVMIQELDAGDAVKLLGWKQQQEIIELLNNSDILLAPSVTSRDGDQEGIPVVLMEAMAMGSAVVSTQHSGIPEVVENGVSGFLVPERDVSALAEKLSYLIDHPEIWPKMGKAGRTYVEEHYSIDRLNAQLVEIYRELLIKNPIMSVQFNPLVSVVIPVFNDSDRLKTCLEALENQTYPKSLYEVIVVDNGSDESIEGIVSQFGQAVATYESRPGSYAARNKGFSLAKGEVIAFTDADCIPVSDWIEKGVGNLLRVPDCGLVAGKIQMTFKNPNQPTAMEIFDSTHFNQKWFVKELSYGLTANFFTFRSVIEHVGVFDDQLKSCGDVDWGKRIFVAGYQQIYADDTCVAHPTRNSYGQIYKRYTRVVGGDYDLKIKNGVSYKTIIKDTIIYLKPPVKKICQILFGKEVFFFGDQGVNVSGQKL